jgi:hypothetical protein
MNIAIAPAVLDRLSLPTWNGLSDTERLAAASHISDRLAAHGWQLVEGPILRQFGPAGDLQTVVQWRDGRMAGPTFPDVEPQPPGGMPFSLIPGGTFRPGYSRQLLPEYDAVYRILQAADFPGPEELDEDEEEFPRDEDEEDSHESDDFPYLDLVYGCPYNWRCDLRAKPGVTVRPFLMAAEPVLGSTPGIADLKGEEPRFRRRSRPFEAHFFTWPETQRVLRLFGWDLPASVEFEWALRGDREGLFYWGNAIPTWLARRQTSMPVPQDRLTSAVTFDDLMRPDFEPERPRRWPWCNRFGLANMLGAPTWCALSSVPRDEFPYVYRGGARYCYPWQYCREWRLFLTAIECRKSQHYDRDKAVRAIVRLVAE